MNSYFCKMINIDEITIIEIYNKEFNPISILNKSPMENTAIFLNTIFSFAIRKHILLNNLKILNICSEIFPDFKYKIVNSTSEKIDVTLNFIFDEKDYDYDNFISIKREDYLSLYDLLMKSKYLKKISSPKGLKPNNIVIIALIIIDFLLTITSINLVITIIINVLIIFFYVLYELLNLKSEFKLKKYWRLHRKEMDDWYRKTTGEEPPTIKIIKK